MKSQIPESTALDKRKLLKSVLSPKTELVRKHFDIDPDVDEKLRIFAAVQGMSQKDVVVLALEGLFKTRGFKVPK